MKNEQLDAYNIQGFNAFHKIRNREDKSHGGGVSVYVNEEIHIQESFFPDSDIIDAVTLIVRPNYLPRNIPWFGILAIYIPPCDVKLHEIKNFISFEIDRLLAKNPKAIVYIMGDFNQFDDSFLLKLTGFSQIILSPTRGDNLIDKCFTNAPYSNEVIILPPIASSDHATIRILPRQHKLPNNDKSFKMIRKKNKSSYQSMGNILSNFDWKIWENISDINEATNLFHQFILNLYEICFPLTSIQIKSNKPPWINNKIINMIKLRNSEYKAENWESTAHLNNSIKRLTNDAKRKYMEKFNRFANDQTHEFYQRLNSLTGNKKKINNIKFPNSSIEDSEEQIKLFFNQLAIVHSSYNPNELEYHHDDLSPPIIQNFEVYKALCKIKCHSSAAPFDAPPFIYREFAAFLSDPITHIINRSLQLGICPDQWKYSYLIPLPKVRCPMSPDNIRPISITSPISKICEKVILNFTLGHVKDQLDCNQFGGIPGRSVTQYISIFLHRINSELQNNNSICTLVTDFSKAFDNADHSMIFDHFLPMNPPVVASKWIASFLYQRKQILRDHKYSNELNFQCTNGIPQGTVLGPFLFAILVNNLAKEAQGSLKYVDDLTVSCTFDKSSINHPQSTFDIISKESMEINLPLNIKKCSYICFDFKRQKLPITIVKDGLALNQLSSLNLLGIVIQDNLKWDGHVDNIIRKANAKMYLIYTMRRIGMDRWLMRSVYISSIRSILEYGSPIWHPGLTKKLTSDLERVQNRIIRIIMGQDYQGRTHALSILSLESLHDRREKLHSSFAIKFLENFPNFCPPSQGQISGRITRGSNLLRIPTVCTVRMQKSPIISYMNVMNENIKSL